MDTQTLELIGRHRLASELERLRAAAERLLARAPKNPRSRSLLASVRP